MTRNKHVRRALIAVAAALLATGAAHAGSIPKELRCHWCKTSSDSDNTTEIYERKDCRGEDSTLTVSAKDFLWRESACDVLASKPYGMTYGRTGYRVSFKCDGEGLKWTATFDIFIENSEKRELIMNLVKASKETPQ